MYKNNFFRLFTIILFTLITLHIFIIDLKIQNIDISSNYISNFFREYGVSINSFDIIWIIFGIFIFDYYNNYYFVCKYKKKYKVISGIISFIISFLIIIITSLYNYGDARIMYYSLAQIYKCLFVFLGYFIFFYITIIRFFRSE